MLASVVLQVGRAHARCSDPARREILHFAIVQVIIIENRIVHARLAALVFPSLVVAQLGKARVWTILVLGQVVSAVTIIVDEVIHLRHQVVIVFVVLLARLLFTRSFGSFGFAIEIWIARVTTESLATHRASIEVIRPILELLLIAWFAWLGWVSATTVLLTVSVLLLDVLDHTLLRAVVIIRIDHSVDGLEVVILAVWIDRVLGEPSVIGALVWEQLALDVKLPTVISCLPGLLHSSFEIGVDEDFCLTIDVVFIIG